MIDKIKVLANIISHSEKYNLNDNEVEMLKGIFWDLHSFIADMMCEIVDSSGLCDNSDLEMDYFDNYE